MEPEAIDKLGNIPYLNVCILLPTFILQRVVWTSFFALPKGVTRSTHNTQDARTGDNMVPWIRKWVMGTGFHSEQGAESIHALFNCLKRTCSKIHCRGSSSSRGNTTSEMPLSTLQFIQLPRRGSVSLETKSRSQLFMCYCTTLNIHG